MKNKLFVILIILTFSCTVYAQQKQPLNLDLYFNRTLSDSDRVKINDNIKQYSLQINESPQKAALYVNRGVQYTYMGLYAEAISDYNKAIKLDSTVVEAYYNRGIAKAHFTYTKSACSDIKKSAVLGLPQGKDLYEKKCGLFIKDLGQLKN